MKNQEQYDFSRPSPSGQPGFEIVAIPGQQLWCFQGNDVNGSPVLFSQTYRTEDSAQRGLKTALNLLKKKSVQVKETPEGWQVILLAGNHQELARSLPFGEEGLCRKNLSFFQRVAASQNPLAEAKPAPEVPDSQPAAPEAEEEPIRYAFRLYFYSGSKGEPLTGRLEQMGNPAVKTTFKGLDGAAMVEFLHQHVKEEVVVAQEAPKKEPRALSAQSPKMPPLSTLTVKGRPVKGDKSVELVFATPEAPGESAVENCTLSMRNMDTRQTTVLNNVPAERIATDKFNIRLVTSQIPKGTYYLHASVWVQQKAKNTPQRVQGTGWLQLV
ncbi:MAG: hypothetical protein IPH12_10640 [Saprospirales bacterium]|jgi:hypothetical protein|nr:hypothetical protein [Saprospirales bacterium]MBK8922270.1 hypothetical protein [Saprospirales bacterium]